MNKKRLYTVLKAVFWCVIGAFLGSTIYTCWDYYARPGLYALTSAPWYTSIVMYGILTAIAAAGNVHGKKEAEIKASPRPSAGGLRVI